MVSSRMPPIVPAEKGMDQIHVKEKMALRVSIHGAHELRLSHLSARGEVSVEVFDETP